MSFSLVLTPPQRHPPRGNTAAVPSAPRSSNAAAPWMMRSRSPNVAARFVENRILPPWRVSSRRTSLCILPTAGLLAGAQPYQSPHLASPPLSSAATRADLMDEDAIETKPRPAPTSLLRSTIVGGGEPVKAPVRPRIVASATTPTPLRPAIWTSSASTVALARLIKGGWSEHGVLQWSGQQ